jgi:hypothetical protein
MPFGLKHELKILGGAAIETAPPLMSLSFYFIVQVTSCLIIFVDI